MSTSVARPLHFACGTLTAIALVGCTSWHAASGIDASTLSAITHVGDTVRVTTKTGATQELEIVSLADGTLQGVTRAGEPVVVRAQDLVELEYRAPAPRKTVWLVLGAVFGAGLLDAHDSCEPTGPFGAPACLDD